MCHKYGNEGKCRFLFPHDIVEASYFDEESNSIMLAVRDPTVNYHNQYILVFCRHNHDLKCILSGKSAKAAMMYITDYITKMDLKTYQLLSMLSDAVVNLNRPGSEVVDLQSLVLNDTKRLLHSCLSQFAQQREIHAQQAVRLIRGFEGSWESHKTAVMLSRALVCHVKRIYRLSFSELSFPAQDNIAQANTAQSGEESDSDEEEGEQETVRLETDDDGKLIRTNQVWDYYLRDERLNSVCFYEFVLHYKLVKSKAQTKNSGSKLALKAEHQLCDTHELVECKSETVVVPRVYGCSVPRPSNIKEYQLFVLAHFKPFGVNDPLISNDSSLTSEFEQFSFSNLAKTVMENWNALYESEDAREDDRMKKRAAALKENRMIRELCRKGCSIDDTLNALDVSTLASSIPDLECKNIANTLAGGGWFAPPTHLEAEKDFKEPDKRTYEPRFLKVSENQMRRWRAELKCAENIVKKGRRCEGCERHWEQWTC